MHFSEERSKTRLSSPPAPLDTEHTPSLITLEKLNCLSFTAPIAVTLFPFSPSFYLLLTLTSSSCVLLTPPTLTSSLPNTNNMRRGGKGLLQETKWYPVGVVQHLRIAPWFSGILFAHAGGLLAEQQKPPLQIRRPCTYAGTPFFHPAIHAEHREHSRFPLGEGSPQVLSGTLASGEGKVNTEGRLARWNYSKGD